MLKYLWGKRPIDPKLLTYRRLVSQLVCDGAGHNFMTASQGEAPRVVEDRPVTDYFGDHLSPADLQEIGGAAGTHAAIGMAITEAMQRGVRCPKRLGRVALSIIDS
ncbi:MAG: hypothetical protein AAFV45_14970 [Pseudomonadota bacterium]